PLGTLMKNNIRNAWITSITTLGKDILFLEGALLGPHAVWEASGHIEHFHDPMIDCTKCKKRYRADELEVEQPCPHCGNTAWTDIRQFNMMFKTQLGASSDSSAAVY
ncbi:MAG: glycine--tRNA ligase, partial [Phototrophicales bacterium]